MTTELASALPAGFSGVFAQYVHDAADLEYLSPGFLQVFQDFQAKAPIILDIQGCEASPSVTCATTVTGIGFDYRCQSNRSELAPIQIIQNDTVYEYHSTYFNVAFDWSTYDFWRVNISTTWKDLPGHTGAVVAHQNCSLAPAIVEYPVNVTSGKITLSPPTSTVTWNFNDAQIQHPESAVDKSIRLLGTPELDTNNTVWGYEQRSGTHSTLGGIEKVLEQLYTSGINMTEDAVEDSADLRVDGANAWSAARFEKGLSMEAFANNSFASPVPQLIANIRELMLRSSIAIAQQHLGNWTLPPSSNPGSVSMIMSSEAPTQVSTHPGTVQMYHTVYKTNRRILGIAIALMGLVVLAVLPLYWQYWSLGRKVSISPIEIAKALHNAPPLTPRNESEHSHGRPAAAVAVSVLDADAGGTRTRRPQDGSNLDLRGLDALIGHKKVRYGEVGPGMLGFGPVNTTTGRPRHGRLYC